MPVYLALKCNTYLVRCKSVSKILRSYVLLRFSRAVLTFVSCSEPLCRCYLLFSLLCLHYWPKTTILSLEQVFDRGYFLCQLVSFHFNNDICCYIELLSVPLIFSCVCEVFYLIVFFPWLFSNFIFSFITLYFWFRPLQKCGLRPFVTACMAFPWGPLLCKVTIIVSR